VRACVCVCVCMCVCVSAAQGSVCVRVGRVTTRVGRGRRRFRGSSGREGGDGWADGRAEALVAIEMAAMDRQAREAHNVHAAWERRSRRCYSRR